MTGNMTDAVRACARYGNIIGSGRGRHAYLINNVVYKVRHNPKLPLANHDERANYYRLSKIVVPYPIIIPEMTFWEVENEIVVAMPYIDGNPLDECNAWRLKGICDCSKPFGQCALEWTDTISRVCGITDAYFDNVLINANGLHLIDLETDTDYS